jgi:hypothetical protein
MTKVYRLGLVCEAGTHHGIVICEVKRVTHVAAPLFAHESRSGSISYAHNFDVLTDGPKQEKGAVTLSSKERASCPI